LAGDETQILLSQPDPSGYEGYRDMVLLSVLYDTGKMSTIIMGCDLREKDLKISILQELSP
jgi:site-specific recombinase XerD